MTIQQAKKWLAQNDLYDYCGSWAILMSEQDKIRYVQQIHKLSQEETTKD